MQSLMKSLAKPTVTAEETPIVNLPIAQHRFEILDQISRNHVTIISAPTGSGKVICFGIMRTIFNRMTYRQLKCRNTFSKMLRLVARRSTSSSVSPVRLQPSQSPDESPRNETVMLED